MLIVEPFLSRTFDMATRNCYTLVRDFFELNFQIPLGDYANPTQWWHYGLNLYAQLAEAEKFELIHEHPIDWKPADILLMAIDSRVGNHIAVLLPGGKILHHPLNQLSQVSSYGGLWRNKTIAVYRHADASALATQDKSQVAVDDLLSPHSKRLLEDFRARHGLVGAGGI